MLTQPPPGPTLSAQSDQHLQQIARFFDSPAANLSSSARSYRRLLVGYYNRLIPADSSVLEIGCGDGELLRQLDASHKTGVDISAAQLARARNRIPDATFVQQPGEALDLRETFDTIIVSDTLNFAADVEQLFSRLLLVSRPSTRLIVNFHNNLWRPLFGLATWLGVRTAQPASSWLSRQDVSSLLSIAGWEVVKTQPRLLWPVRTPLIGPFFNRVLSPFFSWACSTIFIVARPLPSPLPAPPSVSVVIPARNEAGNIEAAIHRTPDMGAWTELIFVEGNSTDKTWAEIQRVQQAFPHRRIKILQQSGRGKGNAVRDGFAVAEGDILMILDADLTMPPEELPKFYAAIASGRAEFANGSRLVYPMEKQAMQFLNMIANHCFGHAFSWLLGQRVKDTLCGTKVLRRSHYLQIEANRAYFGEFDPFGDFDLLFGADKLNMKIVDIPIRYRDRTYGTTNIHRWKHGWLLLRMVVFAARKLKFV
jgi:SAM-dependent methyltransferase